jgi:alkylation response protein AidB-like acyl-CoA dehydrogenase
MDYEMPAEVLDFRKEVQDFIAKHRTPELEAEMAEHHIHGYGPAASAFMQTMAQEGLAAVAWPKEYGGQDKGALFLWVLAEECSRENVPFDTLTFISVGPAIMRNATEEQKQDILPKVLKGEINFAIGYTEPNAGTDLASLQTRAVRDGDEWVINGQKIYTSSAHLATHVWLAARTEPDAPKHRGISAFVLPLNTPGITVRPLWVMGEGRTNETFYEDVRIPADSLIGEENRGWYIVSGALDLERVAIGTYRPLERTVEDLVAHIKDERPELEHDAIARHAVADAMMRVEVARALATNNAAMVHSGLIPTMEASMGKVWTSDSRERVHDAFMDILGRSGGMHADNAGAPLGGELEAGWRTVPPGRFGGGTNDIQRRIIANRGLGLPR